MGAGDERGLQAKGTATGLEEQVTATGEEFSAWLIKDDAGFERTGDFEANAGGEVGLDEAIDDGAFRALGGEDEVYAGGAGLLAEAFEIGGEGVFLRFEGDEVGKFVAAEDEAWEWRLRVGLVVVSEAGKAGEEGVAALHFSSELIEQGEGVASAGKLEGIGMPEVARALEFVEGGAFGVNQNKAGGSGGRLRDERSEGRAEEFGFAAAGGAGDEKVGGGAVGEIEIVGPAGDVDADEQLGTRLGVREGDGGEENGLGIGARQVGGEVAVVNLENGGLGEGHVDVDVISAVGEFAHGDARAREKAKTDESGAHQGLPNELNGEAEVAAGFDELLGLREEFGLGSGRGLLSEGEDELFEGGLGGL